MGSMDSSRIGQFFGLSPKMSNPLETPGVSDKGGFADLLFGVMSKRVSTAKTTLSATRVSTILPMAESPTGTLAATPLARKLDATRLPGATPRKDEAPAATNPVAGATATDDQRAQVAAKAVADKQKNIVDGAVDGRCDLGDAAEVAPPAEGSAAEDAAGEEIDLQGDAEGGDTGNSDIGQDGTDQAPDQTAAIIVIETQVTPVDAPAADLELAVAAAQAAAAPAAPDAATSAPAADSVDPLTAAQPAVSTDTPNPQADAAATTPAAGQAAAETDSAAPAEVAPADMAADQAALASLALVTDPSAEEAEAQAALLARQNDRRGEDAAGMFRRANQTPRQRAAAASAGTAGAPAQPPATGSAKVPVTPVTTTTNTTPSTVLPLAPVGFDTGLGSAPGLPGWSLNLAQGAITKRPDFIANLRQHLQNLPAHEQMALGIQRSARDGGGRITLQLSPTELGRIHLKLDIDEEKNVRASVSVERPSTLDLLQRDTKALERALQDAGLKMDQNDLSFSLHGGDSDSFSREFGAEGGDIADLMADGSEDELAAALPGPAAVVATADGLVDVQI